VEPEVSDRVFKILRTHPDLLPATAVLLGATISVIQVVEAIRTDKAVLEDRLAP
jgi:hypothetical protein